MFKKVLRSVIFACFKSHLAFIRYCARLMLAGVPVIVIWRSDDPSIALAILIWAPDIWRISLILVPWRPIMQPISWKHKAGRLKSVWKMNDFFKNFFNTIAHWVTEDKELCSHHLEWWVHEYWPVNWHPHLETEREQENWDTQRAFCWCF